VVFTAVLLQIQVFWVVVPCQLVDSYSLSILENGLLRLLGSEEKGTKISLNISDYVPVNVALQLRRLESSKKHVILCPVRILSSYLITLFDI
jgi:hypothetical protein